jgi:hypothetical protein
MWPEFQTDKPLEAVPVDKKKFDNGWANVL